MTHVLSFLVCKKSGFSKNLKIGLNADYKFSVDINSKINIKILSKYIVCISVHNHSDITSLIKTKLYILQFYLNAHIPPVVVEIETYLDCCPPAALVSNGNRRVGGGGCFWFW